MPKGIHPSKRLQDGEATDFRSAIRLDRLQHEYEWEVSLEFARNDPQLPITAKERLAYENTLNDNQKALRIYEEHVKPAEEAAANDMRRLGLDSYADALETGDYSRLAI